MVNRRGEIKPGCLLFLLILALATYYAFAYGEVYLRFYQFKNAMGEEARFSTDKTDDQIRIHLANLADSLELPGDAALITIQRTPTTIIISSDYDETIELPLNKEQLIHFHPVVMSRR